LVVVVGHGLLGWASQNCFLAATVVEDVVHGWDGCFTQFKAEQTNDVEKGSTVELDAVDHGLHHICLAGGTHERDTKVMGKWSNTLQGHNNNFFFCCGGVIH
jgi:hypothetical protein